MHQFLMTNETDPTVLYAKSLLELGEYMHAASVLSLPNPIVTTMAPPLPHLSSPYGIYLRAYSLYLAGEQRKEEDYIELQSEVQKIFLFFVRIAHFTSSGWSIFGWGQRSKDFYLSCLYVPAQLPKLVPQPFNV